MLVVVVVLRPLSRRTTTNIPRLRRFRRTTSIMYSLDFFIFNLERFLHIKVQLALLFETLLLHVADYSGVHCLSVALVFGPNLEPLLGREKGNIVTEVWRQGSKGVPG